MGNPRHSASSGAGSLAQAIDATAGDLYRALGAAGTNSVFSPASIAIALQMALRGARGETASELARFLHLTPEVAGGDALRLLSADLAGAAREHLTFRMPNTMWVQSGLSLLPEFTAWINQVAAADVADADFIHEAEKARQEINRIIAEQTENKIEDLIAPGVVHEDTRLVLANAVYLKAPWAHTFAEQATDDAPFHLDGGGTARVPMMRQTAQFGYCRGDGYQAVVLPYAGERLAMAVVLPDGRLATLADRLATTGLRDALAAARRTQLRLALPRFRLQTQIQLKATLRQLGVVRAFSADDADFSGITTEEFLYIDEVVHKAYIDVDEHGTEAAAATAVVLRMLAAFSPAEPPVTVTVDRPFLFAIVDTASWVPLFLGNVMNPAARA